MNISMDRHGRIVQSGEGTHRQPMGVDEVDNTLSNPVSQAEYLANANAIEYATMAARAHHFGQVQAANAAYQDYVASLAAEYEEFVDAESAEANGGESPLLYAAAMQTMAGGCTDQYTALGGYLLSQDGELAFDRTMNGQVHHGMGQVQNLISQAQADAQAAQAAVAPLVAAAQGGSSVAAALTAAAPSAGGLSSLMSQKIGGVPIPYLAGGLFVLLLLKK
jgi:hypothetical protein